MLFYDKVAYQVIEEKQDVQWKEREKMFIHIKKIINAVLINQLSKNKTKQKSPDLHWFVAFDNSHNANTPPMTEFNGFLQ